ncbi:hypothetical protein [Deinococcus sp. Marseille-Q6407]|uniref:hypothetical protein n=1 Tax=Deinococcus sp. Marseille-Q6407 TaxID=2969223 RepID=UPI0021BFD4F9|nr:hypothetical protein [Deinococcus sp. Marseille-Q6407]
MIERTFLDRAGRPLLDLYRLTNPQALFVTGESLPDLQPIGSTVEVPGSGLKVFVGDSRPRAGQLEVTLATYGQSHGDNFALQREIMSLAPLIGGYSRSPGGTLHIAGYSSVKRTFHGGAQLGGTVTLTLECASPYFWQKEEEPLTIQAGPNTVEVGGVARTGLRLELTAGAAPVTHPEIITDAGVTRWLGEVPTGGRLVLDSLHGLTATLNGQPAHLRVSGPVPWLEPGRRTVTLSPGLSGRLTWQEGEL